MPRGRRREKTARMPSSGTVTGLQGAYRMYATERRLPSTAEKKSLRVVDSFFYFKYDSCFLDKGVEANERRAKRGRGGKDAAGSE